MPDRDRRDWEGDVVYDVWRSGHNPDAIDRDRLSDRYYNGQDADEAARAENRLQDARAQRQRDEQAQEEQAMYEAQCAEEQGRQLAREQEAADAKA